MPKPVLHPAVTCERCRYWHDRAPEPTVAGPRAILAELGRRLLTVLFRRQGHVIAS